MAKKKSDEDEIEVIVLDSDSDDTTESSEEEILPEPTPATRVHPRKQQLKPLKRHGGEVPELLPTPKSQKFDALGKDDFDFKRPPECPVFHPTAEEFENSLEYINSLQQYGEKYGIIRIVPPKGWSPRFAIDEKKFRFIPRIQKLKLVDLKNRTKIDFVTKVKRLWEGREQRQMLHPSIDGTKLDLYELHKLVQSKGGYSKVQDIQHWRTITNELGYRTHLAPYVKRHYKGFLLPLESSLEGRKCSDNKLVTSTETEVATFGFEMSNNCYSLSQFEDTANNFKSMYFLTTEPKSIPSDVVERSYWKIVTSSNPETSNVEVEYGADLNATGSGSGFPSNGCNFVLSNDQKYIDSTWNLNNIPLMEESVLSLINADISGMKSPWLYVGMCFSTFCWHTEDHWTSSINYLHIGETKTWYGIPRSYANQFESLMKSMAPELFEAQPDLLHQLVTTLNPQILMDHNIPVFRTDQHAGEFVVTFPRAYHAGFNQGFNFAEAVNFALPAWVKVGRECIQHYAQVGRGCVFSHDELVCRIAIQSDRISIELAKQCIQDLENVIERELQLRKKIKRLGIEESERELFEVIADDDRQCVKCQTTCFLSAIVPADDKNALAITSSTTEPRTGHNTKIYCLNHHSDKEVCSLTPDEHMLKYRYTVDELIAMIKKLRTRIQVAENNCKNEKLRKSRDTVIVLKDEC